MTTLADRYAIEIERLRKENERLNADSVPKIMLAESVEAVARLREENERLKEALAEICDECHCTKAHKYDVCSHCIAKEVLEVEG